MKPVLGAFRRKPLMPLFLCLILSAAAGSLWFNRLPEEIKEPLGILGRAWMNQPEFRIRADGGAVCSVFIRRAGQAAVLWLAGMTPCSLAVWCLAAAIFGFSMAAVLSALTMETGFLALPLFLLALFPQCLFYIPVVVVLFKWGMKEEKKVRAAAFLILQILLAAGAAAEVWLNSQWMLWVKMLLFR